MRVIKLIPVSNIIIDRYSISPETLNLVDFIRNNNNLELSPIKVQKLSNGQYKLKDGRHRVTAFKLLGLKEIKAKFYDSDSKD